MNNGNSNLQPGCTDQDIGPAFDTKCRQCETMIHPDNLTVLECRHIVCDDHTVMCESINGCNMIICENCSYTNETGNKFCSTECLREYDEKIEE